MSRIGKFHRALIAIVIAVVCTTAVTAKQEQVMTRGFDRDKPFQVNDVDAIDVLSGNLVLSVPIGGEYRSNGTLKYSFVMTYNSHIWDYQHIESGSFGRYIALEYNELIDMVDRITDEDLPPNVNGVESYPAPNFNGGLGWTITLGDLRDGYTYVSPDGASHRFYSTMTGTTTLQDGFSVPVGGKLYTRDSSYLRMTKVDPRVRLIEFPDGIRKVFRCKASDVADCDKRPSPVWLLDEISDPFGNLLHITRMPESRPTTGGSTWTWTFTEKSKTVPPSTSDVATYIQSNEGTTVRSHTLTFLIPNGKTHETRLTSASVAAKGGPATYTFTYKDRDIYRDRGSNWGGTGLKVPFNSANKVSVSTLTQITPPLSAGPWQFTYTEIAPGDPDLNQVIWGSRTFHTSKQDGHLRSVTLPTGGRVEYDYEGRSIPARSCFMKRPGVAQFGPLGVSKRRVYAPGKTTPMGEWSYHTSRYKSATPTATTCNQFKEFVVTTIGPKLPNPPPNPNPAEHRTVTVSFFSAYHDDFDDKGGRPWVKEEHGLPFTKEVDDGSGRYLSELTFQCAADAFDAGAIDAMRRLIPHRAPGETATCGAPLRKKFVRYEHSGLDCSGEDGMCLASQTRVASTREVYPAQTGGDVETYLDTSNTGFDGLGHYRTSTTGGNLFKTVFPQVAGSDERISVTNYNPGVVYNANQQTVTLPARWLLGNYDRTEVKERRNGSPNAAFNVAGTEYDYAPSTGFLRRVRRLSSSTGTRSSNDLVQTFERSNVSDSTVKILERSYGGDSVSQSKLFDDALPTTVLPDKPEYVIERRLQYGATQLVQYVGCDLIEVIHKVEDNTVDAASGLVTTSRAGTGALSSYDYDVLGRLTLFTPQGETATSYQYSPASGSNGPKVTATRSVTGDTIAESITADGFGRVALRKSRIPDNPNGLACSDCWSAQQTTYYVDGQVATSSVVRGENQDFGARMSWHFYDALGRKVMAQTPDNAKTTYLHFGTWHVQENVSTLGARDLFYDRHGRLIKITQGSGMPFRYEYDVAGRLAKTIAIQGNDRDRSTFWYDNRGFLFHELHPELGAQGIKYQYDSRGNPIAKFFPGEPNDYALDMRYDGAERLTDVIRGDKVIKHYAFHPAGTPMAGGQIALAQRLNIVPKPGLTQISTEYTVTTQYAYNPNSGRLASTTVGSSNGFGARTEYGWDSLGQLTTLRYPDLCAAAAPCSRTVSQTFRNGLLRSVGDFASSITYFPNGMARKITHTNGTHDEIGLADNEMPRPARIEFLRTSTQQTFERFGSASDPITYNGAGNITRVPRLSGSDTFGYDDLGRVTAGTVNARLQSYAYDNYGNLVSTTTDGVSRNLAVKTTLTNQLAAGDYDHAGHLRNIPDPRQGVPAGSKYVFEWDSQGMMKHHSASNLGRVFLYDAFDERVATIDYVTPSNTLAESWTARDISNRVLSDFERIGTGPFTRKRDYIHRGSNVLAVVEGDTIQHLHPDHLGTPRLITNANGTVILHRDYFPFGEELVERDEPSRLEFTGHERDSDGTLANGSDIDYMHARYYVPAFGRFLSVDPVLGKTKAPQSWNRYAYASNNPVRRVDPDGRQDMLSFAVRDYHLRKAGLTDEQIQMMYREEAKATAAGVVMGGAGYGGITWRMVKIAIGIAALKETGATVRGTSKGSLGQHAANVAVDAGVGVASGGLANIATSEKVAAAVAGGGAGGFFEGFFGPEITTAKEKLGKAFDGLADYMKEKAAEAMDPFDCWN